MKVEWVCEKCGIKLGNKRPTECPNCGSPAFQSIYLYIEEVRE